jgi:hypothetical protein
VPSEKSSLSPCPQNRRHPRRGRGRERENEEEEEEEEEDEEEAGVSFRDDRH